MIRAALLMLAATISPAAAPQTCSAPVAVPAAVAAAVPHSTYYTDVLPPKRYSHVPRSSIQITFGQEAIDKLCGKPPCGLVFEACTDGNKMALPDPFTTDPETFMRLFRHELGHVAGWSATHGD